MAITKELIDGLIVTIQNLYLADDIPWMVGYSGGKDNKTLAKTFYKDETDATEYYSNMMVRKKENGGKYNEKFLDYQPLETEFEDNEDE